MNSERKVIDSVEALEAALVSLREAEKKFSTYTQEQVDKLIGFFTRQVAIGYDLDGQMRQTADCFATDMLCIKFLQGLPLVGIVGGPANVMYCKKISDYARLKYQKRYLLQKETGKPTVTAGKGDTAAAQTALEP